MAAAGFTPIQIYYSTTPGAVPTAGNLLQGELGLNIADMKLYCENSSGVVTLLASSSGASGDVVGPASATDNAVVRFDGTTGKLVQNSAVTIADTTGDVTAGAYNKVTITAPATSATLTIADGKTLTANNSLVLAGTDGTTMTFPNTSGTVAILALAQTFTAAQTFQAANAVRVEAAATQDAVIIAGRAGGTGSYASTITPTTLSANRTVTLPNADINFATGLGVAQGGTGTTSLTANNVILGNGTSAVQFVAPGSNGNVLTSNGTTWVSQASTGISTGKSIAMAMIFGF